MMARQAKIYFQDQLAGYLIEGDGGYSFSYKKEYLESADPNIHKDFSKQHDQVLDRIDKSFLIDEYKEGYARIFVNKMKQIGL